MIFKDENGRTLDELISLNGKNALITGSAVGIGKAIANRFSEAGANLQLIDIDDKKLDEVSREIASHGKKVESYKIDLSTKHEIDELWKRLEGREPDILVNNAGIYPMKDFLDLDEPFFDKVLGINLKSTLWMCQNMIKTRVKKGGVIINVSSIEAILPFKSDMVHYDTSKAGMGHWSGKGQDPSGRLHQASSQHHLR